MPAKTKLKPKVVRTMITLSAVDHAKLKAAAFEARRSLSAEGGMRVAQTLIDL